MVLENESENVLNETARIEFPSKKPVKELTAYNKYIEEAKLPQKFDSPIRFKTEDRGLFDFNPQ